MWIRPCYDDIMGTWWLHVHRNIFNWLLISLGEIRIRALIQVLKCSGRERKMEHLYLRLDCSLFDITPFTVSIFFILLKFAFQLIFWHFQLVCFYIFSALHKEGAYTYKPHERRGHGETEVAPCIQVRDWIIFFKFGLLIAFLSVQWYL